jgi:hypothetical protein
VSLLEGLAANGGLKNLSNKGISCDQGDFAGGYWCPEELKQEARDSMVTHTSCASVCWFAKCGCEAWCLARQSVLLWSQVPLGAVERCWREASWSWGAGSEVRRVGGWMKRGAGQL